ncbi:MAG: deoxyinosine 3endonuclease (endonuclease V)-like protein [Bacteroidota bacterium]|nr:deoxyinosine 3endonuclease (endonuclease V)-like protein [Bacteroidota bacterium]
MNIAIDVYYTATGAKCVGVLFNWLDEVAVETIITFVSPVDEYVPGQFYKRELPCILAVLEKMKLTSLDAIIIDGYVYTDNQLSYGLGGHLWEKLDEKVPVIGIAKTKFMGNDKTVVPVTRGGSKVPLYVSAIGVDVADAADKVKNMSGAHRIPTILKELDKRTKE